MSEEFPVERFLAAIRGRDAVAARSRVAARLRRWAEGMASTP